jgi:hypothetical protein
MIDIQQKKTSIIEFLKNNGPSLPVRIAKSIQMDPIFASAILSELLSGKKIKMSHMKIGSSSLYLLPGQEEMLEQYTDNLKPTEKEAFLKIKKREIIYEEQENPAIRVALRNLKDFVNTYEEEGKIKWEYIFKKKEIENKKEEGKIKQEIEIQLKEPKPIEKESKKEIPIESEKNIEKKESNKTKKEIELIFTEKIEFYDETKTILDKREIRIEEEIEINKKEVVAIVSLNSSLGKIKYLMISKNKKTTNEEEINSALQRANYHRMPCLFILKKEPTKKIQNIIKNNELIKILIIT